MGSPPSPQSATLAEILAAFGPDSENPHTELIDLDRAKRWTASDDIEALGAAYAFVTDARHAGRIRPPIAHQDCLSFVMSYLERCMRENPDGDWSDTRYGAGRDVVGWFEWAWDDPSQPRATVERWKAWIEALYLGGDKELRLCIETATLEHLFERKGIALFFADWKDHPVFGPGYALALDWAMHHPRGA